MKTAALGPTPRTTACPLLGSQFSYSFLHLCTILLAALSRVVALLIAPHGRTSYAGLSLLYMLALKIKLNDLKVTEGH